MGRSPCCSKQEMNRGAWTSLEDKLLTDYINHKGEGKWRNISREAGLKRCGKSCRLRWLNYLRPGIKRGNISPDEEDLIIRLHKLLGNRWSLIAGRLPGRTDNEIKNYWNTILWKKSEKKQSNKSKNEKKSKMVIQNTRKESENPNHDVDDDDRINVGPKQGKIIGEESEYSDGSENSSEIMLDFNIGEILNSDFMNGKGFVSTDGKISNDSFELNVESEFGSFMGSFFESAGDWFGFDE